MIISVRNLALRGLVCCVGFDDYLKITLSRNLAWFRELCVLSSARDVRTNALVESLIPQAAALGCKLWLYNTDIYWANGADFNKGAAVEEALDVMGREGWYLFTDADIILPSPEREILVYRNHIHGSLRRILENPVAYDDELDWNRLPYNSGPNGNPDTLNPWGYFQLFHSSAPMLQGQRHWYGVNFRHCGGNDAVFAEKFLHKRYFKFDVLHLGKPDKDWCGRVQPRLDGLPIPGAKQAANRHQYFRKLRKGKAYEIKSDTLNQLGEQK